MSRPSDIARRPVLAALLGAVGIGVAGGLIYEVPAFFHRRYRRTPFDDLLSLLADRDNAAKLGTAVLAIRPGFDPQSEARALRRAIGDNSLAQVVADDISHGRLVEIHGWLVPATLASLSALAAKVQ